MNGLKRKEKLESQALYIKIYLQTGDYLYYLFAIRMFVDIINTLISRGWLALLILLLNTIHFMDYQIVNNVNDSDNVVRKKCANKI